MARPLRLAFPDAVYHVTARGHRKEKIFYSDRDHEVFLGKLNEVLERYSIVCYAYCLMDNHYHLLIKTPLANISTGMHDLNASYANWFRVKYDLVGSVFQGRYKSIIVDVDNYALELSAYIHLNPIRAQIVKRIGDYKWSSFSDYIGLKKSIVEKLDTSFILGLIDNDLNKARREYVRFVTERIEMANPLDQLYRGLVLGDDDFIDEIKSKIHSQGRMREIPGTREVDTRGVDDVIDGIIKVEKVKREEIFIKRKGGHIRPLALYLIRKYTPLKLREIGSLFDLDYVAVLMAIRRLKERLKSDRKLSMLKKRIEDILTRNVIC